MPDLSNRHPSVAGILEFFDADHLPAGPVRDISELVGDTARAAAGRLSDDPELAAGLRKLLEGKDCLVRAQLRDLRKLRAAGEGVQVPAASEGGR